MSKFYEETMQGILKATAIDIDKGEIRLSEKENMPVPTYFTADTEMPLNGQNTTTEDGNNKNEAVSH